MPWGRLSAKTHGYWWPGQQAQSLTMTLCQQSRVSSLSLGTTPAWAGSIEDSRQGLRLRLCVAWVYIQFQHFQLCAL